MPTPPKDTQFKKGASGNPNGRPKDHPLKGKVSYAIWEALVKLSQMKKDAAVKKMSDNPTITEIAAWKYIQDYPTDFIDRFCGRIPQKAEVSGPEGDVIEMTLNIKT